MCIIVASIIYIVSGRTIFSKRKQLRAFNSDPTSLTRTLAHPIHGHHDSTATDANKAAWVYTRSAILFLMSLCITWVRLGYEARPLFPTGLDQNVENIHRCHHPRTAYTRLFTRIASPIASPSSREWSCP